MAFGRDLMIQIVAYPLKASLVVSDCLSANDEIQPRDKGWGETQGETFVCNPLKSCNSNGGGGALEK